jgi:hexulose-6-phosphate isomerase
MNPIGMMQGRLSPPIDGKMQTFPWTSWREEFQLAREIGFDLIEWLFDPTGYEDNPLWTGSGLREIQACIRSSGVRVETCCAHYFLAHPFFRVGEAERLRSVTVLEKLIEQSASLGIRTLLLPVLETAEVRTDEERDLLYASLRGPLDRASACGVRLALEMEFPAPRYAELIQKAKHPGLGIYFDTGNITARGYDAVADAGQLASLFLGVHIKDRKVNGPNVLLGTGDVDFPGFFAVLRCSGYTGPIVLETTTGDDYLGNARRHYGFVRTQLAGECS